MRWAALAALIWALLLFLRVIGDAAVAANLSDPADEFLPDIEDGRGGVLVASLAMMLAPLASFPLAAGLWRSLQPRWRPLEGVAGAFLVLSAGLSLAAYACYAMLIQVGSEYADALDPVKQAFAEDGEVLAGLFVVLEQASYSALGAATLLLARLMQGSAVFPRWFAWITGVLGVGMFVFFVASPFVYFMQPAWLLAAAYLMYQNAAAAELEPGEALETREERRERRIFGRPKESGAGAEVAAAIPASGAQANPPRRPAPLRQPRPAPSSRAPADTSWARPGSIERRIETPPEPTSAPEEPLIGGDDHTTPGPQGDAP